MTNKRIIDGFLATIAITMLTVSAMAQDAGPVDANRARAIALWEDVIRAKGGRERLNTVENLMVVSSVDVEAPKRLELMELRKLYVLPDRAWLRGAGSGVSLEAVVISIDRHFCTVSFSPKRANPGLSPCALSTWGAQLIQDPIIYLLETKWIQPKPMRTRVEGSGANRVDVIEAEINALRVEFYLDKKTRLPFKVVTNTSNGVPQSTAHAVLTVKLRDYIDVNGIQMPRTIIRESAARPTMISRDTENASYSFNVDYDKAIFELPAARSESKEEDQSPQPTNDFESSSFSCNSWIDLSSVVE